MSLGSLYCPDPCCPQTEVSLLAPRLSGGYRLEPHWQAGHPREEGARDNKAGHTGEEAGNTRAGHPREEGARDSLIHR